MHRFSSAPINDSLAQCGWPSGNVHNVHKQPVGLRVSAQLHAMLTADTTAVTQGPSATGFTVTPMQAGEYKVQVAFAGGTGPLYLNGTR